MNICLCVKQVPDTTEIKIDPVKNTLIREGVPSILNPYDGYALEAAARLKDQDPNVKIVVVTMGPPQATAVLKEAVSIAADKAYIISGRAFGGSDTLATSYIISEAIKKIEETEGKFDAIFCGKQAIDGDTAQVGPEIAEHLDLPQVTCGLTCKAVPGGLQVVQESDDCKPVIEVKFPCLVTFTKPDFDPRYPNIRRKLMANRMDIPVIGEDTLADIDKTRIGLAGSPTHVKSTFVPKRSNDGIVIKEATAKESAEKLFSLLDEANII